MIEKCKPFVKSGTVVQCNEEAINWCGCLILVTDVYSWGVQGFVKIPTQGDAFIRLNWSQIEFIGQAVLVPSEEEDDE